MPADLAAVM